MSSLESLDLKIRGIVVSRLRKRSVDSAELRLCFLHIQKHGFLITLLKFSWPTGLELVKAARGLEKKLFWKFPFYIKVDAVAQW